MKRSARIRAVRSCRPAACFIEVVEARLLLARFTAGRAYPLVETYSPSGASIGGATAAPSSAKTPAQLRQAYGISGLTFGAVAATGAGQTIAVIDAYDDPAALHDLNAFSAAYGLATFNAGASSPTFTQVNQTGGSELPGVDPNAGSGGATWEEEESLDIEWAHAIAPAANIILVECDAPFDIDLIGAGVDWARSAPGVTAVSMSFGVDESAADASNYNSYLATPPGHSGITFLAATGDDGSPSDFPAYSPNVVAIGGTSLFLNGDHSYASETGWRGSGGGISEFSAQPAYQKYVVTQSNSARTNPDVSILADPTTGVALYDSYDLGSLTPWVQGLEGGTSLATPLWAGLIALANQGRAVSGLSSLNGTTDTLPTLYALPKTDFHDITSGSNGDFSASAGYDLVTGLGTPIANKLVADLASRDESNGAVSASDAGSSSGVDVNFSRAPDAATYTIFRGASSATNIAQANPIGQLAQVGGSIATLTFTDTTAAAGQMYRYFIQTSRPVSDAPGGVLTRNFTNSDIGSTAPAAATGSIRGITFNDTNGNGVQDTGEALGSGKTVFLDLDSDGLLDAGEKSAVTASDGAWSFAGLAAGVYHVRRVFPSGYFSSTPAIDVNLAAGQAVRGLAIGSAAVAASTGTLSGFSFDDTNKNGVYDTGEVKTGGKLIFLDTNDNGVLDSAEKSVISSADGSWSFGGLAAGTYHVRRVFPNGYGYSTALIDLTLAAGQTVSGLAIGSRSSSGATANTASIVGFAFDDTNGDGLFDGSDIYTGGKRIYLDTDDDGILDSNEVSVVTDSSGKFTFTGLAAGAYNVRRVFASGYTYSTAKPTVTLAAGDARTGVLIGTKSA